MPKEFTIDPTNTKGLDLLRALQNKRKQMEIAESALNQHLLNMKHRKAIFNQLSGLMSRVAKKATKDVNENAQQAALRKGAPQVLAKKAGAAAAYAFEKFNFLGNAVMTPANAAKEAGNEVVQKWLNETAQKQQAAAQKQQAAAQKQQEAALQKQGVQDARNEAEKVATQFEAPKRVIQEAQKAAAIAFTKFSERAMKNMTPANAARQAANGVVQKWLNETATKEEKRARADRARSQAELAAQQSGATRAQQKAAGGAASKAIMNNKNANAAAQAGITSVQTLQMAKEHEKKSLQNKLNNTTRAYEQARLLKRQATRNNPLQKYPVEKELELLELHDEMKELERKTKRAKVRKPKNNNNGTQKPTSKNVVNI